MRRFRSKGALVMVAALLLLGDFLWTRGVPPLEADPPATPAATAALYAAAEAALPHPTVAPAVRTTAAVPFLARAVASAPTARPLAAPLPVSTRFAAVAAALRPPLGATPLPARPQPSMAPAPPDARAAALKEALRPVVTARAAMLAGPAPAARLDAVLPPRPWTPPAGIAYIRWWRTA